MNYWISDLSTDLDAAHRAIAHAPSIAAKRTSYYEIAGDYETTPPYDEMLHDLGKLIAAARAACREIKSLKGHTHQWNDDGFCNVCSADGNA